MRWCFSKWVPLLFRKPNKRVEVIQLGDVMDTMLERAGVESEENAGPTKVTAGHDSPVVTSVCLGGRVLGLESDSPFIGGWPWVNHLMCLYLNFLFYWLEVMIVPVSWGWLWVRWNDMFKCFERAWLRANTTPPTVSICCLVVGMCSERGIIRWCHCANMFVWIYINLDTQA